MKEVAQSVDNQRTPVTPAPTALPVLRRKCACGGTPGVSGECEECRRKRTGLQRKSLGAQGPGLAPASVHDVLNSAGQPLDRATQTLMETRFSHDFSRVRIHSDMRAAESARAVNALAYTVGSDIVFGTEHYAPGTTAGRRLLAHELAHVAQQGGTAFQPGTALRVAAPDDILEQQAEAAAYSSAGTLSPANSARTANSARQTSGNVGPLIQRRLLVTGGNKDIRAFIDLLESASGFTLKRDPKTGQVTATASVLRPPSFVLAAELLSIMEDPEQDAELNLGRKQEGVSFGAFPTAAPQEAPRKDGREHLVQQIRIDQFVALEKGAPGSGVAQLAHEMIENYHAHRPALLKEVRAAPGARQQSVWEGEVYAESHQEALEKENLIAGELGHPGPRRNTFKVLMGRKPHRFFRGIQDHEQYFLIWDQTFDDPGGIVSNVRRAPRVRVANYTINGLRPGSNSIPEEASEIISRIAADMLKNPSTSARVEGLINITDSPGTNLDQPERWAAKVEFHLIDELRSITTNSSTEVWGRFHSAGNFTRSDNSVVITLDRPDAVSP